MSLSNGQLSGSIAASTVTVGASNGGYLVNHVGFTGCLPPAPANPLSLDSLCTDPTTNHHTMRLRNTGTSARAVTWSDRDSAQTGSFAARAGTDTFFDVLGGDQVHHIVVTSGSVHARADDEHARTALGPSPCASSSPARARRRLARGGS